MPGSRNPRPRSREPWEYPYDFEDDPTVAESRRELVESTGDFDAGLDCIVRAYWQRYADHVAAWLSSNLKQPAETRDCAEAYRIVACRHAKEARAWNYSSVPSDDLEELYAATGNSLYAWQAIAQTLNGEKKTGGSLFGPSELPYWCAQVVARVAHELTILGTGRQSDPTPENILKILRLSSQGSSAYKQRDAHRRKQAAADLIAELIAAGMPRQRAHTVAFPFIGDPRTKRRYAKRLAPRGRPKGDS